MLIPPSHQRCGATAVFGENRHHRSDTAMARRKISSPRDMGLSSRCYCGSTAETRGNQCDLTELITIGGRTAGLVWWRYGNTAVSWRLVKPPTHQKSDATAVFGENRHHRRDTARHRHDVPEDSTLNSFVVHWVIGIELIIFFSLYLIIRLLTKLRFAQIR